MGTVLIIVGVITALIIAMVGIFIPGIPSIQLLWLLLALDFWWWEVFDVSTAVFIVLTALTAFVFVFDYLASTVGVKLRGGSRPGLVGNILGMVIGFLVFNIPGMLIGCFVGAFVGELIYGYHWKKAASIALGALLGYVTTVIAKLFVWLLFAVTVIYNLIVFLI
ncbi:DUF456 domain-containing protein [Proteinivorax hydrogeniformans]|uniref:DUF456 domain-containing protein n=1 Tax=Proteinivorax hydrogeniformans TaxID=1826727 RepID=A0AAU8HW79_9FIRM